VERLRLSSSYTRWLGFDVAVYLLDDLLVDTGFAHMADHLAEALAEDPVAAICCTHQHEDHVGGAAVVAKQHACPVYLRHAEQRWSEGVAQLAPYRRIFWGHVAPFGAVEMPSVLDTGRRRVRVLPTPGHSRSHVALLDEHTGALLTGDLFIGAGASAVLWYEDPYASARSLRAAAALQPTRMLTGHCGDHLDPASRLRAKAERIEEAAGKILSLHGAGWSPEAIVSQVFPTAGAHDVMLSVLTSGQFSRDNFVKACIQHARPRAGA